MARPQDLTGYVPALEGRLLLLATRDPAPGLAKGLTELGLPWDRVKTLVQARERFYRRGGHEALLVAPGAPARLAREVAVSLRHLAPGLPILTFLDSAAIGPLEPPALSLADLDLTQSLGRKVLRRRLLAGLGRARLSSRSW